MSDTSDDAATPTPSEADLAVENARAAREATGLADTQAFLDSEGASYPDKVADTTAEETEELRGDALQDRARDLGIVGRSAMTADELRDAVADAEVNPTSSAHLPQNTAGGDVD